MSPLNTRRTEPLDRVGRCTCLHGVTGDDEGEEGLAAGLGFRVWAGFHSGFMRVLRVMGGFGPRNYNPEPIVEAAHPTEVHFEDTCCTATCGLTYELRAMGEHFGTDLGAVMCNCRCHPPRTLLNPKPLNLKLKILKRRTRVTPHFFSQEQSTLPLHKMLRKKPMRNHAKLFKPFSLRRNTTAVSLAKP